MIGLYVMLANESAVPSAPYPSSPTMRGSAIC
jgi:hypothetical protein